MSNGTDPVDEVHATRVLIWKRLLIGALVALGLVLGFTSVYNSFVNKTTLSEVRQTAHAVRATQQEGSPTIRRLIAIAEQIKSCTANGPCAKEGDRKTAAAVVGIIAGGKKVTVDVIVAALSCQSDGITSQEALARCTIERSKP